MKTPKEDVLEIEKLISDAYMIPPSGEIWYNEQGLIICHICGKSFNRLSAHIVQTHNMTSGEYKEVYGINKGESLMSRSLLDYHKNKPKNDIRNHSKKTQFKKGNPSCRKGIETRLQGLLNRPIEYKKKDGDD